MPDASGAGSLTRDVWPKHELEAFGSLPWVRRPHLLRGNGRGDN
jgi:hypothetical protein